MQNSVVENTPFVDRRQQSSQAGGTPIRERRQFSDSRDSARPEVDELARAVDSYKLLHRRRFITFEELYDVMVSLGYHR
ncbi:hypothetical protein SH661x_003535 [Planctomicrobium sp. SH661]|uniref:hypothetical protein n=1 Tax=Planctomicrobium sp. SH661 TaxID=3448124 RepID=UPI003F5C08CC